MKFSSSYVTVCCWRKDQANCYRVWFSRNF